MTGVTQYIVNRTENENSQWFEFPAAEGRKGDNDEVDKCVLPPKCVEVGCYRELEVCE